MAGNSNEMGKSYKKVAGPANPGMVARKQYSSMADKPVDNTGKPRFAKEGNSGPEYSGEMKDTRGMGSDFTKPLNNGGVNAEIRGFGRTYNDIGEVSGFITDGYLDKNGTQYGEAAKFNFLPPGMDISNQELCEINEMPLRKIIAESYPGDGWMPAPMDIPE